MKLLILLSFLCSWWNSCSQTNPQVLSESGISSGKLGGPCEGCEAIYLSPIPLLQLNWIDTLPDFIEPGPKLMVSGIVYHKDGSPAKDVVIYIYHTDQTGRYTNKNNDSGWLARHGYIHGWIKTNEKGEYRFYTLRPASYPGSTIEAHIHPVIKEPGLKEYYIDAFLFDDDPFLTDALRRKLEKRGGDGIMKLEEKDGMLVGKRNIYLGKNIPGY